MRTSFTLIMWSVLIYVGFAQAQTLPLTHSMAISKDPEGSHNVFVDYTLRNSGKETLYVLPWGTPLEKILTANVFDVRVEGKRRLYLGPVVKRAVPKPQDYIRLDAGKEITSRIDLADSYDLSNSGSYSVSLHVRIRDVRTKETIRSLSESGSQLRPPLPQLKGEFQLQKGIPIPSGGPRGKLMESKDYAGSCDSDQQNKLDSARSTAEKLADLANRDLTKAFSSASAVYTQWFGAKDAARYVFVQSVYIKIKPALKIVNFHCKPVCRPNWYAYVYPVDPDKVIYLCNLFWRQAVSGIDSRPGTLLHETSHYNDVGGTNDDGGYGVAMAQEIARINPNEAIRNADNYEFFGESF